jgi:hypothetical protein
LLSGSGLKSKAIDKQKIINMNDTNLCRGINWGWIKVTDNYSGDTTELLGELSLIPNLYIKTDFIDVTVMSNPLDGQIIKLDNFIFVYENEDNDSGLVCVYDTFEEKIIKFKNRFEMLSINNNVSMIGDYVSDPLNPKYLLMYNDNDDIARVDFYDESIESWNSILPTINNVDDGLESVSETILSYDYKTINVLDSENNEITKNYVFLYYNNSHFIDNFNPENNIPRYSGKLLMIDVSDLSDIEGNDVANDGNSTLHVVSNEPFETLQRFYDSGEITTSKDFVIFKNRLFIVNDNLPDNGVAKYEYGELGVDDEGNPIKDVVNYSKIIFIEGDRFDIHKYVPLSFDE